MNIIGCGRKNPDSGDVCGETYICELCIIGAECGEALERERERRLLETLRLSAEVERLKKANEEAEAEFLKVLAEAKALRKAGEWCCPKCGAHDDRT